MQNITRCAGCYVREAGHDWRDRMIAEQFHEHPEFLSVSYTTDEVDRHDVIAIAGAFSKMLKPRTIIKENPFVEEVLTGHIIGPEQIEKVNLDKYRRSV